MIGLMIFNILFSILNIFRLAIGDRFIYYYFTADERDCKSSKSVSS